MGKDDLQMDGIDKVIVREMMRDARTPILEIARKVGVSGAAIHQRLRKLEKTGLLSGHHLHINAKVLGYRTTAFLGLFLDKAEDNERIVLELEKIPEVLECHYTTGNYSLFVKIICYDNDHLMTVLSKQIQKISGVSRTETFISLTQTIGRQIEI
ncbi:MAG: Lrp/AsnC ligand binding domain-containing protein [Ichthyobacteriaceae bacterium]|nr:Lrp/AsnC ligand binding domain-containing protein [Ichthyobacteriaceae bacterium]